ncbi:MAG: Sec-independent protein translocase protein TatB [Sulfuricurvum sp.]|uniref:Sec-independent protein translocase protein TatB n=1 Tax=Sulfuricurvum sp. TaxID=2025608 RepID=UPI002603BAFE|nr:Sec-independent protein translocase protein TatB [Sulfuricurvum sp.]MDD2828539.1 Sec-independent protein translocase protein TatB [Sulfuricurvum sp.]MDD4948930.1 Sec-independent protein translocase protein TatB [Sulfuricurvum sp.]
MFGMGLGEIFLIAIIAVLFLGPDKLPSTMVEIAKFFKSVKGTVNSAKATLEEEMKFSEMKQEALSYRDELLSASSDLERLTNVTEIGNEIHSIKNDLDFNTITTAQAPIAPKEAEVITFAPKAKEIVPAISTEIPKENV